MFALEQGLSYVIFQTISFESLGVIQFKYTRPVVVATTPQQSEECPDGEDCDDGDTDGEEEEEPECYYNDRAIDEVYFDYYLEQEDPLELELFPVVCTPSSFEHQVFYIVKAYSEEGYELDSFLKGSPESIDWSFRISDIE